jgi:large subunit ribosomal protein L1
MDFGAEKLIENVASFMETIQRLKPPASKGTYYRSIGISSTMGPGIKIDPVYVKDLLSR